MPRQIDLTPQNLKVTHNPLDQIGVDPAQITKILNTLPKITLQMIEAWVNQMLGYIDQVTGLDLLDFAKQIEALLGITDDLATGLLGNIPLIGPFLSTVTGSSTTGGGGLAAFTRVFTDTFGLLGNPTGLGTGSAGVPTGAIPILGPLINAISTGFGGGTGLSLGGLTSLLAAIPGAGPVLDSIVKSFLGLSGSGYSTTDLTRALESIPGGNIIGTLLPGMASNLGVGHISSVVPELLTNPVFDTANSIIGQGVWTWDGTQGPGSLMTSVYTDATGVLKELFSNPIRVAPGQTLNISTNTKWGNSFSGGADSIALTVAQFAGNVLSSYSTIASIASPGSSGGWTLLSGAYTVPSGIDSIFVRPTVTNAATAGRVWFGGMSVKSASTNILSSLIPGLDASKITSGLFNISQITNLSTLLSGFGTSSSILNQLIGLFPGTTSGLTGLGGLGSIFTDLFGPILGNPTGLGSGAPVVGIPFNNVLGIQGIVDIGNAMLHTWNSLTTAFGGATVATNEVQKIVVSDFGGGTVTGGSIVLKSPIDGASTSAVAYNATAATVQSALTALSSIGAGNLVASGGPLNTAPVTVTFQGTLANMPVGLIGHVDSLTGGTQPRANVSEVALGGDSTTLPTLTSLAQTQTQNATSAMNLSTIATNVLGLRSNRPLFNSINPLSEGSHNLASGAVTDVAATATNAPMSLQIVQQDVTKTFVQVLAASTGTVTNFYLNVYKFDGSGNLQAVYKSADLSSQLGTGTKGWVTGSFAGSPVSTVAGDVLAVEAVVVGSGTVNLRGLTLNDIANHPTAVPKHFAASRNPTGSLQPTSLTGTAVGYGGNQPFVSVGTGTPPPPYQPPITTQYTTPGTYTYTIPAFARVSGAKLDLIVLGGGGGGQANYGTLTYYTGGNAGYWATATTLTCGTDYPVGATNLKTGGSGIVVGAKGLGAGSYWNNGHAGSPSSVTWTDPSSVNHTLTGNGGEGGGNSGTSGTNGKSPGTLTYRSVVYPGGAAVGGNAAGNPPGGGGGGAGPYQTGGDGADGSVWVVARPS